MVKRKLYLLAICVLILPSLVLVSCGKSSATSNTSPTSKLTNPSSPTSATISSSNPATNEATATITVSNVAGPLAYDPSQNEMFIANSVDSVISDINNTNAPTTSGVNSPSSVTYDSGQNEFFVPCPNYWIIPVISDKTNTQITTVPVPQTGIYVQGPAFMILLTARSS